MQLTQEHIDDLFDYIGVTKRRWKSNGDSVQFTCPVHKQLILCKMTKRNIRKR